MQVLDINKIENKLRSFTNKIIRNIFGPKKKKNFWGMNNSSNIDLHDLYGQGNIIQAIKIKT